jgi:hypothetical protein
VAESETFVIKLKGRDNMQTLNLKSKTAQKRSIVQNIVDNVTKGAKSRTYPGFCAGAQETARRLKRILAGKLGTENGLLRDGKLKSWKSINASAKRRTRKKVDPEVTPVEVAPAPKKRVRSVGTKNKPVSMGGGGQ